MNERNEKTKFLCAGRLYCDLIFTGAPRLPTLGTETFAAGLGIYAGGGAFITAATFSALGRSAGLLSFFPSPPFNKIVAQDIAKSRVETSLCEPAPANSDPQVTVAIAAECDRALLSRQAGPAIPKLSADMFLDIEHLHIGELRTLLEHPELVEYARSAGISISLDCGWDDELMEDPTHLAKLIGQVDVFLPNETEASHLEKHGVAVGLSTLTVVKCGAKGARVLGVDGWVTSVPETVNVVDATGAGDAFNGGFVSNWFVNAPLRKCLELGNYCGRMAVQRRGGTAGTANLNASEMADFKTT